MSLRPQDGPSPRGAVPAEAVVALTGLTKRFGAFVAVDDLTFSLEAGTVTGFLGPNGAGKTTTLRVLLGLAEPTAGRALVFGRRYQELDQPARLAGAVLESNDFHPGGAPAPSGPNRLTLVIVAGVVALIALVVVLHLTGVIGAGHHH